MARKVFVALVLFTILGLTFAATSPASAPAEHETVAEEANAPTTKVTIPDAEAAEDPTGSGAIGNDEDNSKGHGLDFAEAAPAGSPIADGAFSNAPTADTATTTTSSPPKSGATTLEATAIAATVAGFSLFYF